MWALYGVLWVWQQLGSFENVANNTNNNSVYAGIALFHSKYNVHNIYTVYMNAITYMQQEVNECITIHKIQPGLKVALFLQ